MKGVHFLLAFALLALASSVVSAYDPSPLQDICVAVNDPKEAVFVNGKVCKDPKLATAEDFFFSGFNIPRNTTTNVFGFNTVTLDVNMLAGLNTLGITLIRIDYGPNGGLTPLHTHPRATETVVVLEGTLYAGFVTSDNRLFAKVLRPGDVFVIPFGLIHFQMNIGKKPAVAIASLNSQNPGFIFVALGTFGTNPPMNPDVLTNSFLLDKKIVIHLQKVFGEI